MIRTKLIQSLLLAAALFCLPATVFAGGEPEQVVNVYSHRHYDADQDVYDLFTEATGIEVNVVQAGADELIERLIAEGSSSPADLLITVDAGRLHRAREAELLQPVDSSVLSANVPAYLRDSDGYWYGITKRARVVAYDTRRTEPGEIETYMDLIDPAMEDRVAVRSSGNIYNISLLAAMIWAHGEEEAERWAEGMRRSFAREPEGNDRDQMRAVVAGVADYAVVNTYYVGRMVTSSDPAEREVGENIGLIFPELDGRGTHVNVSGAGLTAHSPNRENAIRLLEFLTSVEAQQYIAQANYEYPVHPDVEPDPIVASWGELSEAETPLSALGMYSDEATRIFDRVGWQ